MTTEKYPTPKPTLELIRMHDIIDEILNNPEIREQFNWDDSSDVRANLIVIKRTLCWVLNHDEGRWLAENMKAVEKALLERGYNLEHIQ